MELVQRYSFSRL